MNRRLVCFVFLTSMAVAPVTAQVPTATRQSRDVHQIQAAQPPTPAMTGERADIPLTLTEGLPTITAMVNGQGSYRFGLDTGAAGYLRVTPELAQKLGLRQIGEALAADASGRNPTRVPVYEAESLTLGGLSFVKVPTISLTMKRPGLDGVVGMAFFRELLLTIDYGKLKLTAKRGSLPQPNHEDVVDIALARGVIPTVPLKIGDAVHPVHLDTGNTRYPLFMPAAAISKLPTSGTPKDIGAARTISQEIKVQAVPLAAAVSVGTTRLPIEDVGFPSASPTGNLGSLGLKGMVVTIDIANRRARIVPSEGRK